MQVVRRKIDSSFVVIDDSGGPYHVVPKDIDPHNKYDYDEIKQMDWTWEPDPDPVVVYKQALSECNEMRRLAYSSESDGLFFDYQRGEVTKEAWESKVAEIKLRYPKPIEP